MNVENNKFLVRADIDADVGNMRINILIELLESLLKDNVARVVVIGYKGRPGGVVDMKYSTKLFVPVLSEALETEVSFIGYDDFNSNNINDSAKVLILENTRFWKEEEENDDHFSKKLSELGDYYINESFGTAHRTYASTVGVVKYFENNAQLGPHFKKEIEHLSKLIKDPQRPFITLLSGLKKDKLDHLEGLKRISDKVVVSGRLPEYLDEDYSDPKVIVSKLMQDKEDITPHSIEEFEKIVKTAKTILVSGPVGKYEEEGHMLGTKRVFEAVSNNEQAFKVAGGGDTENVIEKLGLYDKFDWVSVGGGAMLYFITHGTLPGLEALGK